MFPESSQILLSSIPPILDRSYSHSILSSRPGIPIAGLCKADMPRPSLPAETELTHYPLVGQPSVNIDAAELAAISLFYNATRIHQIRGSSKKIRLFKDMIFVF